MAASWIHVPENSDFTLLNLPYGVFSTAGRRSNGLRCGVALGDKVVDLSALGDLLASVVDPAVFASSELNEFMACGRPTWRAVRARLIDLFREGGSRELRDNDALVATAVIDKSEVTTHLPAAIGDYTDFFTSREHAFNCGCMFRSPENALNANFLHLPVGYHGRASSVYVSGTNVVRPRGQVKDGAGSIHIPTNALDFEMELGYFVGGPETSPGQVLSLDEAEERIFGVVLLNDWSARDVQTWEYVPLGPFTAKNFATSISPWVVSLEALEPFRCATSVGTQDPIPLPYLQDANYSVYDINLKVEIKGRGMPLFSPVCHTSARNIYWSLRQQLAHHTVTGCRMRPGDLCGTGTISGRDDSSLGSMLELSWNRTRTVALGNGGEVRHFLEDWDVVRMTGFCHKEGVGRIGFGECVGQVLPAGTTLPSVIKASPRRATSLDIRRRENEDRSGDPSDVSQRGFYVGFGVGIACAASVVWLFGSSQLRSPL